MRLKTELNVHVYHLKNILQPLAYVLTFVKPLPTLCGLSNYSH
jgi:hypothetical protein